jgi:hypothetical protein
MNGLKNQLIEVSCLIVKNGLINRAGYSFENDIIYKGHFLDISESRRQALFLSLY